MDSNRIKNLALGMRDSLRAEVTLRLDSVLAEGSVERLESPRQVRGIEMSIAERGREAVVDQAAYTWFNRLCALRFMDSNGYTPVPVVTPRDGQTQPAILADATQDSFDPEWGIPDSVKARVTGLLIGTVASNNPSEDAYEALLTSVCAYYALPMGYLFGESIASSLLVPRGLLAQGSILSRIVEVLDEETCSSVEVMGWLYQFYISERKDEYFRSKKKATAADIPAATQLFTPDWIVAYLTENSLGRLWMLNNPESELAASMDYYVVPEGDEPHIEVTSADEIRVLDPACGSGHILVYAFDLLFRMYEEEGWDSEDIPEMILRNNLFGLEIDQRAAEIASFALEMKAREKDPRFFEKDVDPQITVLRKVPKLDSQEQLLVPRLMERTGLLKAMMHLDEIGSLFVPDALDVFVLTNEFERVAHDGSLFAESVIDKLQLMLDNVHALSKTYHCVIANPPYMRSGNMNAGMNGWVRDHYPDEKADLCTCFIGRSLRFAKEDGYASLVTMHSWMFLGSFENMRMKLISNKGISSMAHLGTRAFNTIGGEVVQTTATVFVNANGFTKGAYLGLASFDSPEKKREAIIEAIENPDCGWCYCVSADDFKSIPGWPIAYWASRGTIDSFASMQSLASVARPRQGLVTGDNGRFLRFWWEVAQGLVEYGCESRDSARTSGKKWFPCNKGGEFRKWYGNNYYVVNWENDGNEIRSFYKNGRLASRPQNVDFYFREGLTWSALSSGSISMRFSPIGFISEHKGTMCFGSSYRDHLLCLSAMNSTSAEACLKVLCPTLDFGEGAVGKVPIPTDCDSLPKSLTERNISISREDWDAFETSWDFIRHPLSYISGEGSDLLTACYARWEMECRDRFDTLKANEEELNRIFARIYHMEGDVPIKVPDDKVSVRLADRDRDARSLISFIIGCLFGRYSWECGALAIANQGDTVRDYCSWSRVAGEDLFFLPDEDGVLPVLIEEWFNDDIVAGIRRWLAHVYGKKTLEKNVAWLEDSIGKDLRTYLCRDFYADHLRIYQKRPIYWMFQSPKKSFQCLIYMHRYDEGTVGTILTRYLRPLEDKLRARLSVLDAPGARAADVREANKVRNMIAELEQWERDVIYPLAHKRVSINLDDGVKVNYNKFPKALAKAPKLSNWK